LARIEQLASAIDVHDLRDLLRDQNNPGGSGSSPIG
jgi:hypothetical protein